MKDLVIEKLYAAVNQDYERISQWYYQKDQAQESCNDLNTFIHKGHFVCEFNVVPVIHDTTSVDGNYA